MLNILRQRKEVVVGFRAALLFSLIITLAGFSVPLAYAQQGTGNIIGVVRDPSGAAVVGATVDIENVDRRDVVRPYWSRRYSRWSRGGGCQPPARRRRFVCDG